MAAIKMTMITKIMAAMASLSLIVFSSIVLAQEATIPALIRTKIPGADATGVISYTVPIPPESEIRLDYNADRLSVSVGGNAQRQFRIFRKDDFSDLAPLECSRGFVGIFTGAVTCAGVSSGDTLFFVREDFVARFMEAESGKVEFGEEPCETTDVFGELVSGALIDGECVALGGVEPGFAFIGPGDAIEEPGFFDQLGGFFGFGGDEDEGVVGEFPEFGDDFTFGVGGGEEEPGFFDQVSDFFGFGGADEGEFGEGEFADGEAFGFGEDLTFGEGFGAGEEFAFEGGFEEGGAVEEPGFFDQVSDFFGFGGAEEEEFAAEIPEETFGFEGGEGEFAGGEAFGFGEEGFEAGEEFAFEGSELGEEPVEEAGFFRRTWRTVSGAVKSAVIVVRNKVGDIVSKIYVKELLPSEEAVEEVADEFLPEFGAEGDGEFLPEEEFQFEESSDFPPSSFDDLAPKQPATVNSAFQNFINGLNQ